MFVDVVLMRIVCICLIRNGEILVGLVKLIENNFGMFLKYEYFGIVWYSFEGECK